MLDAVPNGLVILNKQRQIVFSNDAFYQEAQIEHEGSMIGLRTGEVLNCVYAFESDGGCGTTEFCSTCGSIKSVLQAQQGRKSVQECRIIRHNDRGEEEPLDLRVWATPVDWNGEQFTVFAINDISNEKRRRVLEHIFFHDLRNTAGFIQGMAELATMAGNSDEFESVDYMGLLQRASHQLIDEIEAQRNLLEAESGELELERRQISSLLLLQNVKALYERHVVGEDRLIQIDPQSENMEMLTDPTLLKRVLGNMVKNALEASKPGEIVTMGCDRFGGYVRFWVHNPAFMPRHVQLQIFQRSFTTKGNGRGLGTYSVKLLSERYLKGRVTFRSSSQQGTVFIGLYPTSLNG